MVPAFTNYVLGTKDNDHSLLGAYNIVIIPNLNPFGRKDCENGD